MRFPLISLVIPLVSSDITPNIYHAFISTITITVHLCIAACDVTGTTCLHRVAFLGHSEVGALLISGGCPIDAVNKDGDAAIHIAAREVTSSYHIS